MEPTQCGYSLSLFCLCPVVVWCCGSPKPFAVECALALCCWDVGSGVRRRPLATVQGHATIGFFLNRYRVILQASRPLLEAIFGTHAMWVFSLLFACAFSPLAGMVVCPKPFAVACARPNGLRLSDVATCPDSCCPDWCLRCTCLRLLACGLLPVPRRSWWLCAACVRGEVWCVLCGPGSAGHTFSAFWLRSSAVSVLISLISDMPPTRRQ